MRQKQKIRRSSRVNDEHCSDELLSVYIFNDDFPRRRQEQIVVVTTNCWPAFCHAIINKY